MQPEALEKFKAIFETGQDSDQAAREIFNQIDQETLDEAEDTLAPLLDILSANRDFVLSLIQLVVDENRIEDWWNFLLQAVDRLPASDARQSLENAILDLWLSPNDANSYSKLGLAWAAWQKPGYAETAYNHAIELDPGLAFLYNDRGVLFYNQGDYPQALRDYNKALEFDPHDTVTLKNKIIVLGDMNQYEEAEKTLEIYLAQIPDDVWAIHERGRGKAERGDFEGALPDYDRAIALDANYKWAYQNKGSAFISLERYEEAIEPLNMAISLDPENIRAIHDRGRAHSLLNQYEQAIPDYDRVIAIDPNYKWAYANKAYALRELGRYAESEATFAAAFKLDPNYAWAHKECGVLFERMEELDRAIGEYDLAIASDPGYATAWAYKGNVLRTLERYDDALVALDQAIRLDEEYKWAIHERGLVYFKMDKHAQAIVDFKRVTALDPDYKWAFANMGRSAMELERYDEAEAAYQRALEIDPDYTWVLNERSELFLSLQKYEKAVEDLARAISKDASTPAELVDRARSYQKIGAAYEKLSDYEQRQDVLRKARSDLEEALKLEPANTDALWYLGVVWHDMYAYDWAEEAYLKAINTLDDKDSRDGASLMWNIGKCRNQLGLITNDSERQKRSIQALETTAAKLSDPAQLAECLGDQGQAYLALQDYPEASRVLSQAGELDPKNALLLYLKGKAAYLKGDYAQADEAFMAILNLENPDHGYGPFAWVGRGLVAEAQDQGQNAGDAFRKALGQDQEETAGNLLGRADAFDGLLSFARSAADLEKAIELEPENVDALNSLAWLYADKLPTSANLDRAIDYGKRAVAIQAPGFWRLNYLDTLGWALYKAGNISEAATHIKESSTGLPEPYEIRYHQQLIEKALLQKSSQTS